MSVFTGIRRKYKSFLADLKQNTKNKRFAHKLFIHLIDRWAASNYAPHSKYLNKTVYKNKLINSKFIAIFDGGNPESYRVWEVLSTATIPIIAINTKEYINQSCVNAFAAFLLHSNDNPNTDINIDEKMFKNKFVFAANNYTTNWYYYDGKNGFDIDKLNKLFDNKQFSPFIVLDNWNDLPIFLRYVYKYNDNKNANKFWNQFQKYLNEWITQYIEFKMNQLSYLLLDSMKEVTVNTTIKPGESTAMSLSSNVTTMKVDVNTSCLLLWYKMGSSENDNCNPGGIKHMTHHMVTHAILEALYRNCSYLILNKKLELEQKHDNFGHNFGYTYSYWDFFDLDNIKIVDSNSNKSMELIIKSSEYFDQYLKQILNISNHQIIMNNDLFQCRDFEQSVLYKDKMTNNQMVFIRSPTKCHICCGPWAHRSCFEYWKPYNVYIPIANHLLITSYNIMNEMKNQVMLRSDKIFTNYCWITIMIRRGDRGHAYTKPHQFGIKPKGITIIIYYLITHFCDVSDQTAKIIYIAVEPSKESMKYLSYIKSTVNTRINQNNDIYILSSTDLCNYYNHCHNNYLLFSLERLLLFHSNINQIEPSHGEIIKEMHVNVHLTRNNTNHIITNGSVWFHPQAGYHFSSKDIYSKYPNQIIFTTNNDIKHHIKYEDIISFYGNKMSDSLVDFLNDWKLANSKFDNYQYMYQDQYIVNNPICKILFPSSISFLYHHKTGTTLAHKLRDVIQTYCNITNKIDYLEEYYAANGWINFRDNPQSLYQLQGTDEENIKIHFWRDPVLTIVSGFNYHMTCNEHWANRKLSVDKLNIAAEFFNFETEIHLLYQYYFNATHTFDDTYEPPIWRYKMSNKQIDALKKFYGNSNTVWHFKERGIRILYMYYLNDIIYKINSRMHKEFYGFKFNFSDEWIHSKFNIFVGNDSVRAVNFNKYINFNGWYSSMFTSDETINYGLYFEMMRYLFIVYPKIYDYHFNKMNDKMNELKMEIWNTNFSQNMNVILDGLKLIDNEQNRNKLRINGLTNVDIMKERNILSTLMQQKDGVNIMPRDNGIDTLIKEMEIEKMLKINKARIKRDNVEREDQINTARNDTKYIDVLLTIDIRICLLLKHITNIVEYGWNYPEYC